MGAETRPSQKASVGKPLKVAPLEGHRLWSETYDADPNPMLALEFRIVSGMTGNLLGKLFLDLGCGTGRWLAEARRQGARILGVDLCRDMLVQAERKAGLAGRVALADVRRLPVPDSSADVALCAFCLAYLESLFTVMQELGRAVKPGGEVVTSDLHPQTHSRGWTRSFRSGSQVYEIEQHPYSARELLDAGHRAGLKLEELVEARFAEPEREIFRRAGREHLFEELREIPAVLIARWKRR